MPASTGYHSRFARIPLSTSDLQSMALTVFLFRFCAMRRAPARRIGARRSMAFKRRVQERSLRPADLRAPTITLSNFGSIAGSHASLIVVPPQVAILGAGRTAVGPVQGPDGSVGLHRTLPLSLTFDHRAVTGGMAARFLRAVIAELTSAPRS
jgi:pyruvate/2-oxoglutarate dehydrogenase complex dihydrolipoamide acyltransferase (E2) component